MTKAPNRLTSLLHRLGVTGPARVRVFAGSRLSKISFSQVELPAGARRSVLGFVSTLCVVVGALLLTSAPAALASEGCENEARRVEQGSTFLPDCRAYELVSQPSQPAPYHPEYFNGFPPSQQTHLTAGASFFTGLEPFNMPQSLPNNVSIAQDGNAALYSTFNEGNSESDSFTANLSRRGPDGWIGENIIPPRSRHGWLCNATGNPGFSANLEEVAIDIGLGETLAAEAGEDCGHAEPSVAPGESHETANLFLRNTATGSFQLVNVTPATAKPYDPHLVAISSDGSHVVFVSRAQLTSDAPNGEALDSSSTNGHCTNPFGNVYIWYAGEVHLVTVLPNGTPVRGALAGNQPDTCSSRERNASFTHSMSADGERIVFYAGGGSETGENGGVAPTAPYIDGGLYLREHPSAEGSGECVEQTNACTVQIDLPQGVAGSGGAGQFRWASADDSKIFFLDEKKLTPDSSAEAGKPDLYEYDIEKPAGQRLADLTVDASESADVLGVSGASEDGSYLYFVAHADLSGAQQNSRGETPLPPAQGSGALSGGVEATANLVSASASELEVSVISGQFEVGQEIHGVGIKPGTTITACSPDCSTPTAISLSGSTDPGTGGHSGEHIYVLGSPDITGVNTTSGAFREGMALSGPGIAPNTMITAVGPGTITLSQGAGGAGNEPLSATAANLYLLHGGTTTFIVTLSEDGGDRCDWSTICLTSRVSQNGRFIAFDSIDSLTGYDNHPARPEACQHLTLISDSPCIEAYRYAADSGELTCATCNPTGAPPAAEFAWSVIQQADRADFPSEGVMAMTNAVSDTGQVFFETMETLVPADENETWDVYEYEGGEGPSAQLYLISSGKSPLPSFFVDATPDGSNVFLETFQSLLRAATRNNYSVYDARVGGGFASQSEAVQPPACEAIEACRSPLSEPPAEFSAASAVLVGGGNLVGAPGQLGVEKPAKKTTGKVIKCPKGKKLSHGKCVKKKPKKSKTKKSTGRKGSK